MDFHLGCEPLGGKALHVSSDHHDCFCSDSIIFIIVEIVVCNPCLTLPEEGVEEFSVPVPVMWVGDSDLLLSF